MNEDVKALKDALETLNTQKSISRRILSGMLSKNSENLKLQNYHGNVGYVSVLRKQQSE